jgi:hypothetical protein
MVLGPRLYDVRQAASAGAGGGVGWGVGQGDMDSPRPAKTRQGGGGWLAPAQRFPVLLLFETPAGHHVAYYNAPPASSPPASPVANARRHGSA